MFKGVGILSQRTIPLKWLRICDFYQSSGDKGPKGFDGPVGLKGQTGEKQTPFLSIMFVCKFNFKYSGLQLVFLLDTFILSSLLIYLFFTF